MLLEGIEERSAQAAQALMAAFPNGIAQGQVGMVGPNNDVKATVGLPIGATGNFGLRIAGVRGQMTVTSEGIISGKTPIVKAAHTRILGKDDDPESITRAKQRREAGQTLAEKILKFVNGTPELAARIQRTFAQIANTIKISVNDFAALAKSVGMESQRAAGFFVGGSNTSLESRLSNISFKLTVKDGKLVKVKVQPDAEARAKVTEKLSDLLNVAMGEKQSAKSEACKALTKQFAMMGGLNNRSLVVAVDSNVMDNDSVAISDSTGIYEKTLKSAYKKCGKRLSPEEISISSDSTGGANANRGFAFEEVPQILALFSAISQEQDPGKKACLQKQLKDANGKLFKKLNKLSKETEGWTETEANTAISVEDQATLDMAKSLVEQAGGAKNKREFNNSLVRSMIPYGQHIQNRGSIMALPAGEDTGQGKRQDVLEVFEDCDKAKEALAKSGNDLGVEPQPTKVSDLSKDQRKSLACFQKQGSEGGQAQLGDEVCIVNTSLKNYRGIGGGVTTGSQRGGSQGNTADVVDAHLKGELTLEETELSTEEKKELDDYKKELQEIGDRAKKRVGGMSPQDENRSRKIRKNIKRIENREDPKIVLAKRIIEADENYKQKLGLDDQQHQKAAAIIKESSDLNNFIINNPEADVNLGDGKVLDSYDVFDSVGNIIVEKLFDSLDIDENSEQANELRQIVEDHKDSPSDKARRKVAAFIEKQSLMSKINQGDPDAVNALKLKMMRVGGDSTDSLGLEIRDIDNNKIYGFKHNQPLEEAFENLGQPDSEWQIDGGSPGSSDITLVHPTKGKIKMEARIVSTGPGSYTTQYSVHYDKKLIENYNKYGKGMVAEALDLISQALWVLKEKVAIV